MAICDKDCFNCKFDDCIVNDIYDKRETIAPKNLPEKIKSVIRCYAKNDMNGRKTTTEMLMSHTNINYRLNRCKELTGLDPKSFYGLVELVKKIDRGTEKTGEIIHTGKATGG